MNDDNLIAEFDYISRIIDSALGGLKHDGLNTASASAREHIRNAILLKIKQDLEGDEDGETDQQ